MTGSSTLEDEAAYRQAEAQALVDINRTEYRTAAAEAEFFQTTTWYPVDLDRVLDGLEPEEPPVYFARSDDARLLYPDRSHVFYGPSESLKSWAALAAAASVVEAQRTVFYVDFESDRREFVRRARVVGIPDAALRRSARPRLVYLNPGEPLDGRQATEELLAEGRRYDPALVVIDGISDAYMLHGLDPMSVRDVAEFHRRLLRRFPCTTLGVDHTAKGKSGKQSQTGALGSQHKRAGVDVVFEFVPKQAQGRSGHSFADVYVTKDRLGLVRDIATPDKFVGRFHVNTGPPSAGLWEQYDGPPVGLMAPPAAGSAEAAAHEHQVAELRERVWEFVEANPGSSGRKVQDGVGGRRDWVDSALAQLAAEGRIEDRGTESRSAFHLPPPTPGQKPTPGVGGKPTPKPTPARTPAVAGAGVDGGSLPPPGNDEEGDAE